MIIGEAAVMARDAVRQQPADLASVLVSVLRACRMIYFFRAEPANARLEFTRVFPQIVPEPGNPAPAASAKTGSKLLAELRYQLQVI